MDDKGADAELRQFLKFLEAKPGSLLESALKETEHKQKKDENPRDLFGASEIAIASCQKIEELIRKGSVQAESLFDPSLQIEIRSNAS